MCHYCALHLRYVATMSKNHMLYVLATVYEKFICMNAEQCPVCYVHEALKLSAHLLLAVSNNYRC